MASERTSSRAFLGIAALLFAASAAVTIVWCASMSAVGEMRMPGGWTMSMAWMRMPGQTWAGAATSRTSPPLSLPNVADVGAEGPAAGAREILARTLGGRRAPARTRSRRRAEVEIGRRVTQV